MSSSAQYHAETDVPHALSVDKQTSASWHQDGGTKTVQFTTKRRSGRTLILFKLKLRGMWKNLLLFSLCQFGLFDVMVMMKLNFMHIILY